jgi:hypothetical protein
MKWNKILGNNLGKYYGFGCEKWRKKFYPMILILGCKRLKLK